LALYKQRESWVEEKTFFEYDDVKVTNTRFITGSQTFAMSNVTSVKTQVDKPSKLWPLLGIVIGLAIASGAPPIGIGVVLVCVAILFLRKPLYHVMVTTSGTETSALKTKQREYLERVVGALNEAIVHRG